jgi:hypothetical protein
MFALSVRGMYWRYLAIGSINFDTDRRKTGLASDAWG